MRGWGRAREILYRFSQPTAFELRDHQKARHGQPRWGDCQRWFLSLVWRERMASRRFQLLQSQLSRTEVPRLPCLFHLYRPLTEPYYSHGSLRQPFERCVGRKPGMGGRETAIQRPKIWQARMTASLRMMAALRPISTKEIDRIRDAQPTGLSGCGKTRSGTASRSALISPPQEIRVVLRSWRHQIVCEAGDKRLARSPAKKRILPHQGFLTLAIARRRRAIRCRLLFR